MQPAELVGAGLEHLVTDRDLAVAGNHNLAVAAHNQDRRAMHSGIHEIANHPSVTNAAFGLARTASVGRLAVTNAVANAMLAF